MNEEYKLTMSQAEEEMSVLRKLFTSVRLLDMSGKDVKGSDKPCGDHEMWINGLICENCVSRKAMETHEQATKLEFLDGSIYQVMARYVEIDGRPYIMEIMKQFSAGSVINVNGREEPAEKLVNYRDEVYSDVLTGAKNRRYYEEQLKDENISAGVVMIDLDDFKLYNDTFGHGAGDAVLRTVVNSVRRCIRETDDLVRYGGDEFLLILPGVTPDAFSQKLRHISRVIGKANVPGYAGIRVSVSMGGVIAEDERAEDAVSRADKLMYQAKTRKNTIVTEQSPLLPAAGDKLEVLIVDDSEENRGLLTEILGSGFVIHEASGGEECLSILEQRGTNIALVLLDIIMPGMDGFQVLNIMNENHWIEDIPVIMISTDNSPESIRQAYEKGVSDYIGRPFDARVVRQRVLNTIKLCARQRRLIRLLSDQINESEKNNRMMTSILSHIVEFRNGESGLHVLHIRELTEMLLEHLSAVSDKYSITDSDRELIPTASALHDIGKIGIDDKILNKPGKLTPEEFNIMKTHTVIGAEMLEDLEQFQNEELVKTAHEICRWHHERWDGRGYPDGLKGDEIPISAQLVSIADVYDALVSERVYKKAFPHDKAVKMILDGECGAFNPLLLRCFTDIQEEIRARFSK